MLRLHEFPLKVGGTRVSFHDGFGDMRQHSGLAHQATDIAALEGTPIVSATPGRVLRQWQSRRRQQVIGCGWHARAGNIVLILDPNGYVHYYAHMLTVRVRSGDTIGAGRSLGAVSNTGSIAQGGPMHLHYQVWAIGPGRETETSTLTFERPFGRAVNPYPELVRLARGMGATVMRNGGVRFN